MCAACKNDQLKESCAAQWDVTFCLIVFFCWTYSSFCLGEEWGLSKCHFEKNTEYLITFFFSSLLLFLLLPWIAEFFVPLEKEMGGWTDLQLGFIFFFLFLAKIIFLWKYKLNLQSIQSIVYIFYLKLNRNCLWYTIQKSSFLFLFCIMSNLFQFDRYLYK